jgi:hypothetical protein
MNLRERIDTVRTIAQEFVGLTESEGDLVLRAADTGVATPRSYDGMEAAERRNQMIRILGELHEEDLVVLRDYFTGGEKTPAATSTVVHAQDLPAPPSPVGRWAPIAPDGPVFVVHGHAEATLHQTVRVLEKATGREVIVLHEQPNSGRTILEKFEDHAATASYAVVLLTADDVGGIATADDQSPRGRQNVVFELGFFFGKLGRQRVAVLLDAGVEKPSDIDGLVYIPLDRGGAWKQAIAKELAAANIEVDYSRIP